jgi:hypothetical protein
MISFFLNNVGDPFEFAKNSIEAAREAGLF